MLEISKRKKCRIFKKKTFLFKKMNIFHILSKILLINKIVIGIISKIKNATLGKIFRPFLQAPTSSSKLQNLNSFLIHQNAPCVQCQSRKFLDDPFYIKLECISLVICGIPCF